MGKAPAEVSNAIFVAQKETGKKEEEEASDEEVEGEKGEKEEKEEIEEKETWEEKIASSSNAEVNSKIASGSNKGKGHDMPPLKSGKNWQCSPTLVLPQSESPSEMRC